MPESANESESILEILQRVLKRAERRLGAQNLSRGDLAFFTTPVRAQLAKIYGKDAPLLAHFSSIASDLPPEHVGGELSRRIDHLRRIIASLEQVPQTSTSPMMGKRIFIGHGRSPLWRELKDFIADRLGLPWDEFNREAVAGFTTSERLQAMLSDAGFAFLIMTAEEEHAGGALHARPNVVHEAGLFQGQLGLRRAIVMLEDGCSEFSNIVGLSQIRFPPHDIRARFEDVRRVLEREGLISA